VNCAFATGTPERRSRLHWSKTEDNSSEIFSNIQRGNSVAGAQNPFDTSAGEKALSGLDFLTRLLYFIYELPFFKSQHGFIGHVLGAFQTTGTWRYSTGQLWTPLELVGFNGNSCQNSYDTPS